MPHCFNHVDLARLAAYIDGEGHISITSKDGGTVASHMMIQVGNTDPRLSTWLKGTFGGNLKDVTTPIRKKRYWLWYANGRVGAELLRQCLPYFVMKRDQAEIAIAFQSLVGLSKSQPSRSRSGNTRQVLTPELVEKRTALMFHLREVREASSERIA